MLVGWLAMCAVRVDAVSEAFVRRMALALDCRALSGYSNV